MEIFICIFNKKFNQENFSHQFCILFQLIIIVNLFIQYVNVCLYIIILITMQWFQLTPKL